jgi:RIO kinase 1
LGTLRAGKEAGCFLVRRRSGERWCLLVRKDYRRRSDREPKNAIRAGERGIRRDSYVEAVLTSSPGRIDGRLRRAAAKRTDFGGEVIEGIWASREFLTLRTLWAAGASVPYPVEEVHHAFYMQYIGTLGAAAPRLSELRPDADDAAALFLRLVDELRIFVRQGIVHADLSEYNILVQHGRPWIIDVPQAVDLHAHPRGRELFARDVARLCTYFTRRGVVCDAGAVTTELLAS